MKIVITRAHHWYLSWGKRIHSTTFHPISLSYPFIYAHVSQMVSFLQVF